MGYGRINAGKALEMLQAPWVLTQSTVAGGLEEYTGVGNERIIFRNPGSGSLPAGLYVARRVPVTQTISLPYFSSPTYLWGRGANATTGYSGANPNFQLGYCQVVSSDKYSAKLRTWVYYVVSDQLGRPINQYYPCAPSQVVFAYTTLGVPGTPPILPLSVSIDGPTYSGNNASWYVSASGGDRTYAYAWTIDYGDGQGYQPFAGNGPSASAYVSGYLHVNVVVTSAGQTASAESYALPQSGGYRLSIYPNPAQDYLIVDNAPVEKVTDLSPPAAVEYTIRLYDQNGILRRTAVTKNGQSRLATDELPTGNYYLQATQGKATTKLQVFIRH